MKIRVKGNQTTSALIKSLLSAARERKAPIWRAVAREIGRPRRAQRAVNLYHLNRYAKGVEHILVPGTVLGIGEISEKMQIAALRFSASARKRIEQRGGRCLSIEELMAVNPTGRGVRIIG